MRFLAVSSLVGVAATDNSSVKKVVNLLDDMRGKISADLEAGQKEADEYSDWCIKTTTELTADVNYGSEKVDELAAAAEKGAGVAGAKAAEAKELAAAIGKAQAKQKELQKERKEQNQAFAAEETELVEADTMLGKAHGVLKRALSFVQVDGQKSAQVQYTEEVVAALGAIIDSAWVNSQDSSHIKSFMQEDQPQAKTSNYQSKSGGILDAIQGMQEKNAEVLSKLREAEMKNRHSFEMAMQDQKNKEESKGDQMSAAKAAGAKAAAAAKEAESNGVDAQENLAADKKALGETKAGCESAAKEWATRKAEGDDEVNVIGQAIDILSGKFGGPAPKEEEAAPAFIQVKDDAEFNRRAKAASLLRKMSRKFNQYGLMQLAQSAGDDPFVKVRGMINDMITKLEDEQQKEASKEAKCKADKQKGEKDLKIRKNDFNKLLARSDAAEAKFAKLGNEIADLENQLKELASSVKEATKMRNEEAATNAATIKDSAESIEALNGAITVLTDFYGADQAPAFIQVKKQGDTAAVIIEILQTAQEDFEKLKQETEAAESKSNDKYEKDMQAAEVSKAKKTASKEGKQSEKATVKKSIATISEDLGDAEKALAASQDFLKGVMEACANKAMSFEERQQRRAAEIAGLKEALEILSPEAEFVQTGKFMAKN